MNSSKTNPFFFSPFSEVMHRGDASTSLRKSAQNVTNSGRAWCGDSLTERGSVTHLTYKQQHSTMMVLHRSVPQIIKHNLKNPFLYHSLTLNGAAHG